MNILLVSQYLSAGGLERIVHLLSQSLVEKFQCKVTLFSFDREADPELIQSLENKGIQVVHSQKGPGFCFKTLSQLKRLIKDNAIDVIHTHETAPLMYASLAKLTSFRKPPIVHTQHSFIHLQSRPKIQKYDRWFQKLASHVTTVSAQMKNEYVRIGVDASRITIIDNGVEFPNHFLNPSEKIQSRKKLLPKNSPDLLWLIAIARVHPRKGQDHLIRVWAELPENLRRTSLLIFVGPETEAGERQRLNEILKNTPHQQNIVFAGATNNPMEWLLAADVFLSGSELEGMPLAPIEACGAGLPLILSNITGHLLLKNQAHLFQYDNPKEGASQLQECLQEKKNNPEAFAAQLQLRAKNAKEQYGIQKMAEQYYKLYLSSV